MCLLVYIQSYVYHTSIDRYPSTYGSGNMGTYIHYIVRPANSVLSSAYCFQNNDLENDHQVVLNTDKSSQLPYYS